MQKLYEGVEPQVGVTEVKVEVAQRIEFRRWDTGSEITSKPLNQMRKEHLGPGFGVRKGMFPPRKSLMSERYSNLVRGDADLRVCLYQRRVRDSSRLAQRPRR
eukprot:3148185-Rhodomonas_salina.1